MRRIPLLPAALLATLLAALSFAPAMHATPPGPVATPAEARALLGRAIAALRQDEAAALASFNQADGAYRDRDLYVFCIGPGARTTAHASAAELGRDATGLEDAQGFRFGEAILATAAEDRVDTVDYAWPLPGGTAPVPKTSYVTRVGGQACGVGFYRP